ncbi:MAG: sugar phosphate isomerase/epimerase family protein [Planctomycetota bacterium]
MPGIRIGIQLAGLRLPFKQALHVAARLGVEGVEIDARTELRPSELVGTGLRQVRKMLEDLNLRVAAVRYATRRGYETTEELDRRIEGTKRAMKMAYDLGANVVVNHVGTIESDPAHPSREVLRSVLSDLGGYSQRIGAFLACETGSEPLARLGELIESLPDGSVGVTLNPGNLLVNGFQLEDLSRVAKHVMLVHAKDGVPDRARGRGTQVPLGYGLAEFPNIAATLEEHAYRGYFVVERDMAANPVEEFRNSVEFLRNL